jgi:ribonuclease Z
MEKIFQVTILGCSAATPTSVRHTTAQALLYHNKLFLLDCAEGTQIQIRRYKLPMMRINHIFISHLHGDHYLGLAGLLFSYHLLGRKNHIHIYAPPGLEEIINVQFRITRLEPQFPMIFHDLTKGGELIYEDRHLTVETLEMEHRLPAYGFLFREKPLPRNIRKEKIAEYNIPISSMAGLKAGRDFTTAAGQVIANEVLTTAPTPPRTYAFCSDTAYTEKFMEQIRGADLLYHEATFLQDKADIAREKTHSTTVEAATLAQKAGVKKLLLGHYSARYKDMDLFRQEAAGVFPNTLLAEEGKVVQVGEGEQHSQ